MGNQSDHDRQVSKGDQERGTNFNQQGQQVNGPQYNADQINIGQSISPDDIAEGLRQDRERTLRDKEAAARARREHVAQIQHEMNQRKQEERDVELYGYRYYTRDRNRWLQSLPSEERWNEQRRQSARVKHGKRPRDDHRRVLRAGNLPPDTSPADARYVKAKREVDRKEDKRERLYFIVSMGGMVALILIAVLDDAIWLALILVLVAIIGLVSGYAKRRSST